MCLDVTLSFEKPNFSLQVTCFVFRSLQSIWLFTGLFFLLGGPNIWAITSEERAKHDKQFDSLKPTGGYITGWYEILYYTLTFMYT